MSSILSGLAGVAEKSGEQALAFGLGFALGAALEPAGTGLRQEAWKLDPLRAPDAETLAQGVAQGQVDPGQAAEWATENGYGSAQFDALVSIANTGPALGYAYAAWRRGELSDQEFDTALKRTGLEEQWYAAMRALKGERLDLGQLATAIHRGIIAGEGLLLVEPPTGGGRVPSVPQSPIDATAEAAAHGIDPERLRVLVGNTGLPLSLGEMLQLKNRGSVTDDDVKRSVAESNVRNEYMDVALDLARRLLTPREYAEADLRGVLTHSEAQAGAGLSGLESQDYETLFETVGRPLNVHALTTGLARGGTFGGTYTDVPEPYQDAIRRSNVRPEYAKLAYANRYTYPSAFVLRTMAQAGDLGDEKAVEQILLEIGWHPDFAAKIAKAWMGGTTKGDPHIGKAENQVWTALHKSYVDNLSTDAETSADLEAVGVHPDSIANVLSLWKAEREIVRRSLTPAQIKKAVGENLLTTQAATQRLLDLGYTSQDAQTLLAE